MPETTTETTTTIDEPKRQRKPLPEAAKAARFVRREQLPALTGVPVATWETWASRPPACGPPPMLKLGRAVLYPLPELFEWLAKKATAT